MRQMLLQIPRGQGARVAEQARACEATNLVVFGGDGEDGPCDCVVADVPNGAVGDLLDALEPVEGLRVSMAPQGVFALGPPPDEAPRQVMDVGARSPVEVVLAALQSVGSWAGFLSYAALAGAVVWVGLLTDTVFLLVAAMLIAPFAGPAVNGAIATARGDAGLLGRALARYLVAIATTIAVAALLTLVLGPGEPTASMRETATVSGVALLLPLAAGAAGALQLVQSERSSLVSGAAVGLLVAAALAPPAGVAGMAAVLGAWEMVGNAAFLLTLQLAGINLAGALVFRLFGVTSRGSRYPRGRPRVVPVVLAVNVALLAGLLVLQLTGPVTLERASAARRAATAASEAVADTGLGTVVASDVRFTLPDGGDPVLLAELTVRSAPGAGADAQRRMVSEVTERLRDEVPGDFVPLVDVTVLSPPRG